MSIMRLKYLDFIKGFAILLVVLGHVIQFSDNSFDNNILFRYIYSFHMPLFMFTSGFASCKQKNPYFIVNKTISYHIPLKDGLFQIKKRLLQLLLPFFAWFIIGEFVHWRFEPIQLYRLVMNPEVGLWFLWCLFFIFTMFTMIHMLVRKNHLLFMILAAIILFGMTGIFDIKIFGLKLIAYYNMFYLMGYFIRSNLTCITPILMKYVWLFLLLFIVLAYFWRRQEMPSFMDVDSYLIRTLYKIVVACMGIFATFALSLKYVMQDNSAKYMRILLHLGTITLGVYACHFLVISPVLLIFSGLWYPLKLVLAFILVTTLSYTIVRILSLNRYTAFILLGIAVNTKNKF